LPVLLEVHEVARELKVSPEFVRRLLRERKLAAVRLGKRWRVDQRDLQSFIDRQRLGATIAPFERRDAQNHEAP
jgi:excisionase family DNA binding protein